MVAHVSIALLRVTNVVVLPAGSILDATLIGSTRRHPSGWRSLTSCLPFGNARGADEPLRALIRAAAQKNARNIIATGVHIAHVTFSPNAVAPLVDRLTRCCGR